MSTELKLGVTAFFLIGDIIRIGMIGKTRDIMTKRDAQSVWPFLWC